MRSRFGSIGLISLMCPIQPTNSMLSAVISIGLIGLICPIQPTSGMLSAVISIGLISLICPILSIKATPRVTG